MPTESTETKIVIKSIFGSVLFQSTKTTVKEALEEAVEARAYLARANLADANLAGANLARANLAGANLARANLAGANLARANLADANLADANLADANLADANLAGANLAGATIFGEKITKAPISISGFPWSILITDTHMKIGCDLRLISDWLEAETLDSKHGDKAEALWQANKGWLLTLAAQHRVIKAESKEAA